MRAKWKQAGVVLLSVLIVWLAFEAFIAVNLRLHTGFFAVFTGAAVVCLAVYLAAVNWIERRVPTELSLHRAVPEIVAGVLGGIALFSLVMGLLWVAGVYRPEALRTFDGPGLGLGLQLVFWLAVATEEEILHRGLLFRLCSKIAGTWGALLLTAVFFGAKHSADPGATFEGWYGVLLAGALLGAAYALTGRLWLPIGLHTGWNFAEGSLFGTQVSGNAIGSGLIRGKLIGPNFLTGGRFGPEASIVTWIALVGGAAYLLWRIAKLQRAEPPIWSNASQVPVKTAPQAM